MAQAGATDGKVSMPDPRWGRTRTGSFHRLAYLDPEALGLTGMSGVFVVWHGGVRPRWLWIARSDDLAASLHARADDAIMGYEVNGGVFATWALIRPELQDGVVGFLTKILRPAIANPDLPGPEVDLVPVQIPRSKAMQEEADQLNSDLD